MGKKRGNAEGSVYQRESDGRWVSSLVANDGRRVYLYGRTRAEVDAKLTDAKKQKKDHVPMAHGRETLGEYLASWLADVVSVRNKLKTQEGYRGLVENHILPAIGSKRLAKLEPADIQKMEAGLLKAGLSANTVHHVHVVLRKAIQDAIMQKRGVYWNACDAVQAPSPGRYEVKVPDPAQVSRILESASETEYGTLFHFIAFTGVRRGEAVALKWENVDLDRAVVSITQTAQRIGKQGIMVSSTKSAAGHRGIALDAGTVEMLRDHRGRQVLVQLEMGEKYQDHGLVFPGPLGSMLDPSAFTHNFKKLARKVGAPGLRLHDLRHHHAAGLVRAGVHPRVVQERMGHGSAAFTMQVYGHVSPGMQAQAADAFAHLMQAARDGQNGN